MGSVIILTVVCLLFLESVGTLSEAANSKSIFSESVSYVEKNPTQKATLDVAVNGS